MNPVLLAVADTTSVGAGFPCRPLSLGFAFEVDDWSVSCPAELRAANLTGAEV